MSRFRLFGRPASSPPPYPAPAYGTPPPAVPAGTGWPGSAAWPPAPPAPPVPSDAPTDPFGFPPIRPVAAPPEPSSGRPAPPGAAWPLGSPPIASPPGSPRPGSPPLGSPPPGSPRPGPPPAGQGRSQRNPDPAEAASLAGAFAVDYLSWDEDDPARRGRVLVDYLPSPGRDPARLGWPGRGRQRAEFALPGLVRSDGAGRVLVDVRVRVTPYRSVGDHGPDPSTDPQPDVAGIPAVAPAPTGRGWRSLASYWIRISVPVAVEGNRLVVDAGEETLGEEPAPPAPVPVDDHSLADDDPLATPAAPAGGGW